MKNKYVEDFLITFFGVIIGALIVGYRNFDIALIAAGAGALSVGLRWAKNKFFSK